MKVLVSDSSILIEFSKRDLLDKMFQLDFEVAVPDLLFHEELIDLGPYSRRDLLGLGLRAESLDAEGVKAAIGYQSERPALSLFDSFALALASHQGWNLLTKDRTMRSVAQSKGISHRDALWGHRQHAECRHLIGAPGRRGATSYAERPEVSRSQS